MKTADQFGLACCMQEKVAAINSKSVTACLEWFRVCEQEDKEEAGELVATSIAYGVVQVVNLVQMLR